MSLPLSKFTPGADESDEMRRVERPPPCLCGLDELGGHRYAGCP